MIFFFSFFRLHLFICINISTLVSHVRILVCTYSLTYNGSYTHMMKVKSGRRSGQNSNCCRARSHLVSPFVSSTYGIQAFLSLDLKNSFGLEIQLKKNHGYNALARKTLPSFWAWIQGLRFVFRQLWLRMFDIICIDWISYDMKKDANKLFYRGNK